jgi:hypothetical protein
MLVSLRFLIYQPINNYVWVVGYELHQQRRAGWLSCRRAVVAAHYAVMGRNNACRRKWSDMRGLHSGYWDMLRRVPGPEQDYC